MTDTVIEQPVKVEQTYSEQEIRQFLIDQECSFPDYSRYQNPGAEEVAASPVFDDRVIRTTDSDFTFANLVGKVVRYANTFPIADGYDDHGERRAWRKRLEAGGPLEQAAFNYLQQYNSLRINNITYAVTTCPLLPLAVRPEYPEVAEKFSAIGNKYLELIKNEKGKSIYDQKSMEDKVALTENLRREIAELLQEVVSFSVKKAI